MSFLKKIKVLGDNMGKSLQDSYHEQQKKIADLNDLRGKKLSSLKVEYIGGYSDKRKAKGSLNFYEKRTEFFSIVGTQFIIPNSQIKNVVTEGKDEVNRRITVTRLLAVGIFAFALKKKEKDKESYITLELVDGQEIIFFIDNQAPMPLRAKLANSISVVKQTSKNDDELVTVHNSVASIADELTRLADLKEKGILSAAEFNAQKAKILNRE